MHPTQNKIARSLLFTLFILSISFFLTEIAWGADHSAKPDARLTGTHWKLLSLNGKAVTLGATEKELQIILTGKNQVRGFSGCNRFTGSYETDGGQLQRGPMATTMMMCAEGMEQEQFFFANTGECETF